MHDDDICPEAKDGKHRPDWSTVTTEYDGEWYVDVTCKLCGRSGCVGKAETLAEDICW